MGCYADVQNCAESFTDFVIQLQYEVKYILRAGSRHLVWLLTISNQQHFFCQIQQGLNRKKHKLLLPVHFIFLFETLFWTKTRLIHFKANLNQMQNWFNILLGEFNQVKTLSFPKTATLSTFNFSKLWQHQNVHSKQIEELISVDASEFANFPAIWSNTG